MTKDINQKPKRWSKDELDIVERMADRGDKLREIASALGRTPHSVQSRLARLAFVRCWPEIKWEARNDVESPREYIYD